MKKIFKLFLYVFVFLAFFIYFLPKESFYNLLEKELEKNQIVVSNETKDDKAFSFVVSNAEIFYQGINGAKIDEMRFQTYLFYTNISLKNINILERLSSFIPTPIDEVIINHSIFNFYKIKIKSKGIFGELIGDVNLFTKELKLELNASDKMKTSYPKLLKDMKFENERYFYEYKF